MTPAATTEFNNRIVNPTLQPLKGYWTVIDDCGQWGQYWHRVSWSNSPPAGCAMEVWVPASDKRLELSNERFVAVSNNVPFTGVNGRYIEVRAALVRDDSSKQPVLYHLTLHGVSSGFAGELFLYGGWAEEGEDAYFWTDLVGAEPMGYQWARAYPWRQTG